MLLPLPCKTIKYYLLLLAVLSYGSFLMSCSTKSANSNAGIKKKLRLVDSFYYNDNYDSARRTLADLRKLIKPSNPLIAVYYYDEGEYFVQDSTLKLRLADSALAVFSHEKKISKYPDEYFKALMLKGDAYLSSGKFIIALNYYFKSKNALKQLSLCDNGDLDDKLSMIYYAQKNYALAAKYATESYNRLGKCNGNIIKDKLFYLQQGDLDNIGLAYEHAGMLDSARAYYLKDIQLLNKYGKNHTIDTAHINSAQAVVYDNLGGLNIKTGNLAEARFYLERSIAFRVQNTSASGITAYIKAADMYTRLGELDKAAFALNKAQYLITTYHDSNPDSKIALDLTYSRYLLKKNDLAGAYAYLEKYNEAKSELDKQNSSLYRLDVVHEFNTLEQKEVLNELKQSNEQKETLVLGITLIGLLSVAVILLIYRNLKRTKKSNKLITDQNSQLQYTLQELERVNKNYIRIMRVMAHDLRNPISGMTGLAAVMLEDGDLSDDCKHMLKLIESTGLHTIEMISELLKTGLADENARIVKTPLDLKELVFDSVELLQFKANEKQQKILFQCDEAPIIANVNHEKMWRVINNLIVNAIKFSHNGGEIRVSVTADKNSARIAVADNGIGIPKDQEDVIFEMFTPAKKVGTDGEQPFGLGLSISKRIMDMHYGRIWFESKVNEGTTFYIEVPLK
jgi:signal transduction histidine kinase